ncbi:MAG: AAA family ATPase [Microgenomates group bacterium]|jgi:NadR type nicotinamide-nucleotide adenylyltransferase
MIKGLVIGKFYPPHLGHKYLIDTASSQVDHLTVIVCGKKAQTISPKLRAKWIREIHPKVKVMVIDESDLDPDDSKIWAKKTIEWLGFVPDLVFTSEDYGEPYAKFMGSKHILVDRERVHVPCSGTMIRQNPLKYWKYLEPNVRAYFVKKICVLGAESTGTTTLAKDLAKHYETSWVPEYGRIYYEAKMFSPEGNMWVDKEFVHIAKEQNRLEDILARRANRLLICDTDAFATTLWNERYVGKISPEVKAVSKKHSYDLYLLTGDEIPFVQDGTRDGEHIRHQMHVRFIEELKKSKKNFVVLEGSQKTRLNSAIQLIDESLKQSKYFFTV